MSNNLTFNPENHEYKWEGVIVPSVTQVLAGAGLINFDAVNKSLLVRAQKFGTAVHLACQYDDKGVLDESNLDTSIAPYLAAWRLFQREYGFLPEVIETPLYSNIYRFAGTPDRVGRWRIDGHIVLVEIKTANNHNPATAIQTAGYTLLVKENFPKYEKIKQLSVLLGNGAYKIQEHKDKNDKNIFIAALAVYNWRKKNGYANNGT